MQKELIKNLPSFQRFIKKRVKTGFFPIPQNQRRWRQKQQFS